MSAAAMNEALLTPDRPRVLQMLATATTQGDYPCRGTQRRMENSAAAH
jgi:hypothetical protein